LKPLFPYTKNMRIQKAKYNFVREQHGMTLIEVLITMVVLAMVLYPIYEFLRQGALAWEVGENRTEVVQNARIGLDKMCDEIKSAYRLYSIAPETIRFWWQDSNGNELADSNEIITFSWSAVPGTDLTRKRDDEVSPAPIANYVDRFELRYYNAAGAETANSAEVTLISATLLIKKTRGDVQYRSIMRKSVHLRNL